MYLILCNFFVVDLKIEYDSSGMCNGMGPS